MKLEVKLFNNNFIYFIHLFMCLFLILFLFFRMKVLVICLLSVFSVVPAGDSFFGNRKYFCRNAASVRLSCNVENPDKFVYWVKELDTGSKIVAFKTLSSGKLDALVPRYKMTKALSLTIYDPVEGEEFRCYMDDDVSGGTTLTLVKYKKPDLMGIDGCDTYPCMIAIDIASTEGLTCGSSGHIPNDGVRVTWHQLSSKDLRELHQRKRVYDVQKSVKVETITTVYCIIEGSIGCCIYGSRW
ncbi:uncharacterized protein LOC117122108 [Anneissia japonica]|uniref:uncharacterized protein LOC117122108 n=1 Tax=Anneissia japonica TaxID=1529436 RepID=UPI0014256128|nr:uncharacterized protein LOC117122108 [Anneissia japonica]